MKAFPCGTQGNAFDLPQSVFDADIALTAVVLNSGQQQFTYFDCRTRASLRRPADFCRKSQPGAWPNDCTNLK